MYNFEFMPQKNVENHVTVKKYCLDKCKTKVPFYYFSKFVQFKVHVPKKFKNSPSVKNNFWDKSTRKLSSNFSRNLYHFKLMSQKMSNFRPAVEKCRWNKSARKVPRCFFFFSKFIRFKVHFPTKFWKESLSEKLLFIFSNICTIPRSSQKRLKAFLSWKNIF